MIGNKGITLTFAGRDCCNPECNRPLYVELLASYDSDACFECDFEQFKEHAPERWSAFNCLNCSRMLVVGEYVGHYAPTCKTCYLGWLHGGEYRSTLPPGNPFTC